MTSNKSASVLMCGLVGVISAVAVYINGLVRDRPQIIESRDSTVVAGPANSQHLARDSDRRTRRKGRIPRYLPVRELIADAGTATLELSAHSVGERDQETIHRFVAYVAVRGLAPIADQIREFCDALDAPELEEMFWQKDNAEYYREHKNQIGFDQLVELLPVYTDFTLERQKLVAGPDFVTDPWVPVKTGLAIEILTAVIDSYDDPVGTDLQDAVMTMGIPFQLNGMSRGHASHPKLSANVNSYLFRYFDFDVTPGETYRYRVKLELGNPNWERRSDDVEDMEFTRNIYASTEWSDVSNPVVVPAVNPN